MKTRLLALLIAGVSADASANEFIPYYGNDPFLFCTYGVPADCWVPVRKETGEYRITDHTCFKKWSASLFSRVCTKAFPDGAEDKSEPGEPMPASSNPFQLPTDPNATANLAAKRDHAAAGP